MPARLVQVGNFLLPMFSKIAIRSSGGYGM
jgi:hypothetical protein